MTGAQPKPCNECPWRRKSAPGWLGPLSVEEWLMMAHSELPIACHQTIEVDEEWTDGTLQCRGAAIFRSNICKLPRDPAIVTGPADRDAVFSWDDEFQAHHG